MHDSESALVTLFPTVDPVVASHRSILDSGAVRGVSAHVTLLYPFIPPTQISATTVDAIAEILGSIDPFDVTFDAVGWFGDEFVHLRPTPDDPFRRLTSMIETRWPEWPPYGGAHDDPAPHLTIGDTGTHDDLLRAAEAIAPSLPIAAHVSDVHLMTGTHEPNSWSIRTRFPLGRH